MEWIQVLTIIGVNITLFGGLMTLVIWVVNRIDSDVKALCARQDAQTQRIDQLYGMFIDLLKEGRK